MAQATLFDPSTHEGMLSQFAAIQIACIESDKMIADFMPPLNAENMTRWWTEKASQITSELRSRHIIFMEENGQATGVVMLEMKTHETGNYRGEVQKLIVSPQHRQKGIARKMMGKLEEVARSEGRTLLLLDTETNSPADRVYPKWGYRKYGIIPQYERRPNGGFADETFYYKDLAAPDAMTIPLT